MGHKPRTSIRKRDRKRAGQTQKEEGHVESEAETRVMQWKPRDSYSHKDTGRGKKGSVPRAFKGSMALLTLDFRLMAPRTVRKKISLVWPPITAAP